jgi:hypothetical protein
VILTCRHESGDKVISKLKQKDLCDAVTWLYCRKLKHQASSKTLNVLFSRKVSCFLLFEQPSSVLPQAKKLNIKNFK